MNWLVVAAGFARVVVGPGFDPPDMQPDDALLFVHKTNQCLPDAGMPDGGGSGSGIVLDAGALPDAAMAFAPPPEAAIPDAGPPDDGGIPDAGTMACDSDTVMMVVQPRFTIASRGSKFALLYVTPAPPVMRLESPNTFDDLATLTAPDIDTQIVEIPDPALGTQCPGCGGGGDYNGGGCNFESNPSWDPPGGGGGVGGSMIQTVGPYEIAARQPTSRTDVAKWLDDLGYIYTDQDLTALEPYFSQGWSVVAVRVSQAAAFSGGLEPLSMTWAGSDVTIPLRLASQSSLTVYIAGDHRYEVPNAHVSFAANTGSTFLTRNDVSDLSSDLTAYRASVDSYTHDVMTVYQDMHVPVTKCEDQGCCQSGPGATNGIMWSGALLLVMRNRRRRRR